MCAYESGLISDDIDGEEPLSVGMWYELLTMEGILRTRGIIWNVEINPGCYPGFFFLVKRYYPGFISWPADDLKKELYKFTGCHGC